jgi:hypothetical protein
MLARHNRPNEFLLWSWREARASRRLRAREIVNQKSIVLSVDKSEISKT